MANGQSTVHHYVPRWHQRKFLRPGQTNFCYLDLHPAVVYSKGVRHEREALLRWSPKRCFCKDHFYTVRVGTASTDEIERIFFGFIDRRGQDAVEVFQEYAGWLRSMPEGPNPFHYFVGYMGAQRFRTPRALDSLRAALRLESHNQALVVMQEQFQRHATMWAEGVWEIVRARTSPTKFILSDDPVTFYNRKAYPKARPYPNDVSLYSVGTRTIFPLSLDSCLIVTHNQFVRDPGIAPVSRRINARSFGQTMVDLRSIQFGRELEENEVLRINLILKKRATRYISAAEEEWLYPERRISTGWAWLDDDWFLLPNPWKVPFTSEIMMGFRDGTAWGMDEYGRNPGDPGYRDPEQHGRDWVSHDWAEKEWAKKRVGKSVAHVDNTMREDEVADSLMHDYLAEEGLMAPRVKPAKQDVGDDGGDKKASSEAANEPDEPAAA